MRVLIAGGGTGGHLYPALAIADYLKQKCNNIDILFIGSRQGLEATIIPAHGYSLKLIPIIGFSRKLHLSSFAFPFLVIISLVQALQIVFAFKPDLTIGTGGYVSGPPLFAAKLLGKKIVLQEQNSYPGITTRILARLAKCVFLGYESTQVYLSRRVNCILTGNPIRKEINKIEHRAALDFYGFDPKRITILVYGGSQGAQTINRMMLQIYLDLIMKKNCQIIWQTGKGHYAQVSAQLPVTEPRLKVFDYTDRTEMALAAADIVICRAGALTLSEITACGLPSIIIPYPHATANHQVYNGRALADNGAAIVIEEADLNLEKFKNAVEHLLANKQLRKSMADRSRLMGRPNATATIGEMIISLLEKKSSFLQNYEDTFSTL